LGLSRDQVAGEVTPQVTPQVTTQVEKLITAAKGEMTRAELRGALELKDRMHFSRDYLQPALNTGLIEMTIPDKPRSSKQRYRLTDRGRKIVVNTGEEA
jgi:ATP-dependent DNA helicase RecG